MLIQPLPADSDLRCYSAEASCFPSSDELAFGGGRGLSSILPRSAYEGWTGEDGMVLGAVPGLLLWEV